MKTEFLILPRDKNHNDVQNFLENVYFSIKSGTLLFLFNSIKRHFQPHHLSNQKFQTAESKVSIKKSVKVMIQNYTTKLQSNYEFTVFFKMFHIQSEVVFRKKKLLTCQPYIQLKQLFFLIMKMFENFCTRKMNFNIFLQRRLSSPKKLTCFLSKIVELIDFL